MKMMISGIGRWLLLACTVLLSQQAFAVPEYIGTDHGIVIAVTRMDEVYPDPSSYTDTVMRWLQRVYVNYPNIEIVFLDLDPASTGGIHDTLLSSLPAGSFVIFHGSCAVDDLTHCKLGYSTIINGSWSGNPDPIENKEAVFDLSPISLESQEPPDAVSFISLSALVSVFYQRDELSAAGRTCAMALGYTEGVGTELVDNVETLRLHLLNDFRTANQVYEISETIQLAPDNGDLYMERAELNAELGNYTEVVRDIERAIELGPTRETSYELYSSTILRVIKLNRIDHNSGMRIDTGISSYLEGSLDDALVYLDEAIRLNSLDAELYFLRSRVHGYLIDWPLAEEDLSRAIELDSCFTEAYAARGNVNVDMGFTEQAISDFTRAIELAPDSASYYESRSFAYHMCGEIENSDSDLQTASDLRDSGSDREGRQ